MMVDLFNQQPWHNKSMVTTYERIESGHTVCSLPRARMREGVKQSVFSVRPSVRPVKNFEI